MKNIPKGQINFLMGRMHVSSTAAEIEAEIRRRATSPDWTEVYIKRAVKYAIAVNAADKKLCQDFRF